jgi:membrane protease YdiL (CAAX protease family)
MQPAISVARHPGFGPPNGPSARRGLSISWFVLAGVFTLFAQQLAERTGLILSSGPYAALMARITYIVLLLAGYGAMGVLGQRQAHPVAAMGLPARPGFLREWALGAALGWAGIVACVLPIALIGGLLVTNSAGSSAHVAITALTTLLTLLLAALADELVYRGYIFQRLIEATNPTLATIAMTLLFSLSHGLGRGVTAGGTLSNLLLGFVLAMAYLRTRALWLGWGFHFAWNASMAVLFGLPIAGLTGFSPVVSTYLDGPAWVTGGGYGPEGSALAIFVLLALLILVARATRDLRHRWALAEIVSGGIAVDMDAAAARQHDAAMGPKVPLAGETLIQIEPVSPAFKPNPPEE